jgi:hypothetical protein
MKLPSFITNLIKRHKCDHNFHLHKWIVISEYKHCIDAHTGKPVSNIPKDWIVFIKCEYCGKIKTRHFYN